MYFVGIDLAWSIRNGTGVAICQGDKNGIEFIAGDIKYSNQDIIDYICEFIDDNDCIISIDAPLVVPNELGRRFAEAEIGRLFRKYNAGAYPSNRKIFNSWYGGIRGEEISKDLERQRFVHSPNIKQFEQGRIFFEVYPHPSMVVLFNLNTILKYKPKQKRSYIFRYQEFEKYINHLRNLSNSDTKLVLPDYILNQNLSELKGKKLKSFEDKLDGIFCAYIAYYYWKNPDKCRVFGDITKGYIVTPIFDSME